MVGIVHLTSIEMLRKSLSEMPENCPIQTTPSCKGHPSPTTQGAAMIPGNFYNGLQSWLLTCCKPHVQLEYAICIYT